MKEKIRVIHSEAPATLLHDVETYEYELGNFAGVAKAIEAGRVAVLLAELGQNPANTRSYIAQAKDAALNRPFSPESREALFLALYAEAILSKIEQEN
jgi:hypothetical protein